LQPQKRGKKNNLGGEKTLVPSNRRREPILKDLLEGVNVPLTWEEELSPENKKVASTEKGQAEGEPRKKKKSGRRGGSTVPFIERTLPFRDLRWGKTASKKKKT